MNRLWVHVLFLGIISVLVTTIMSRPAFSSEEKQRMFVGVEKCKTCHKTEAQGQQFVLWEKSLHAKAYETLAGDKAKAYAKERGIENAQTAPECLKCHVTAYGVDAKYLDEKFAVTEGVGCESCHGAGGDYYKMSTMKSITSGEIEPASVGLLLPTEKVCVQCHNKESPAFKGFDYAKMVKQIAHPIPADRKAKYKAAAGEK